MMGSAAQVVPIAVFRPRKRVPELDRLSLGAPAESTAGRNIRPRSAARRTVQPTCRIRLRRMMPSHMKKPEKR